MASVETENKSNGNAANSDNDNVVKTSARKNRRAVSLCVCLSVCLFVCLSAMIR